MDTGWPETPPRTSPGPAVGQTGVTVRTAAVDLKGWAQEPRIEPRDRRHKEVPKTTLCQPRKSTRVGEKGTEVDSGGGKDHRQDRAEAASIPPTQVGCS